MDGLRVSIAAAGDADGVVTVAGELDLASADALWAELEQQLRAGRTVVLDCRELEFMDSTGLRVLLRANRRAAEIGAKFTLREVPPAVERVMDLAGVNSEIARS